jgi:hypothetical protein
MADEPNRNKLKEMLETELKEVAVVQGPVEAEVIKSLLASHNIPCIQRGLVVQSVHAFSADGLGQIKIMVTARDYEAAQQLLENTPADSTESSG